METSQALVQMDSVTFCRTYIGTAVERRATSICGQGGSMSLFYADAVSLPVQSGIEQSTCCSCDRCCTLQSIMQNLACDNILFFFLSSRGRSVKFSSLLRSISHYLFTSHNNANVSQEQVRDKGTYLHAFFKVEDTSPGIAQFILLV